MITRVRLDGKPSERLILVGLSQKFDCSFGYNETTGFATINGKNANECKAAYDQIMDIAYKQLARVHTQVRFSLIPVKTINSEFMQAFAAIVYSVTTGSTFKFQSQTEVHREGLMATKGVEI